MGQCTAKSKVNQRQCHNPAIKGRATCRMHGGRAAIGPLNPRAIKNGKYSKHLSGRLLAAYQVGLDDPVLSGLHDELALCDARLNELVTSLEESSGPGQTFVRFRNQFHHLIALLGEQSSVPIQKAIEDIEESIHQGISSDKIWSSLLETMEQRRRCSETENRRIVNMNQAIPIAKVVELVSMICSSIRQHVTHHADSHVAERILRDSSRDVERIIGANNIRSVEPTIPEVEEFDPLS